VWPELGSAVLIGVLPQKWPFSAPNFNSLGVSGDGLHAWGCYLSGAKGLFVMGEFE
jgi:hypothetical protein